jgi:carboxylesterase type B
MKIYIILFASLIFLQEILCSIIKTQYGSIKGFTDGDIIKYLGIPFASPPVRSLRFKEPKPPLSWSDTLETTEYKSACIQNPKDPITNPYMTPKSV